MHSLSVPGACAVLWQEARPCDERVKVCHRAGSMGRWVEPQRLKSKIPTSLDPGRDPSGNYLKIRRYGPETVLLLCVFNLSSFCIRMNSFLSTLFFFFLLPSLISISDTHTHPVVLLPHTLAWMCPFNDLYFAKLFIISSENFSKVLRGSLPNMYKLTSICSTYHFSLHSNNFHCRT